MTTLPASFLRRYGALAAYAVTFLASFGAVAAELHLSVADGPATASTLYVALFDSAKGYAADEAVASQTAPMRGGTAEVVFRGLPEGRYALRMFADENGNAKLDTNLMGLPTERYGFSNDARGHRGAPGFEDAAMAIDADLKTIVHLR